MTGNVAVLGDSDFVLPYSALGLDTFSVEENAEEVKLKADEILKKRYSLIVVAENIAGFAEEIFSETDNKAVPAVVVVPFTAESTGFALASLGRALKVATGIDIVN